MGFLEELKRRNVIRVGIAYGAAAWFILQLGDVVLENIAAPDWVMQTIMLLLAIGFPLVLILAWAFEVTPEGIKREHEVDRSQSITRQTGRKLDRMIIVVLALAVGYLLVDKLWLGPEDDGSGPTADPVALAVEEASVAVLPFVNMSDDVQNEYFSDGLTETLLHMLAQLPDLRVAARTSSFAFKNKNAGIPEIAAALGVAHVLEGSVQKAGERVRVTAQLIRAQDGFHVWSHNYTRPLEDIFAIHDEIATDVAEALGTSLLSRQAQPMHGMETRDVTAYDAYLRGLEQQAVFSYGSLDAAENHFKQALVLDPGFTEARLALIRNYLLMTDTGMLNNEELQRRARPLAQQVREAHPDEVLGMAFEYLLDGKYQYMRAPQDEVREDIYRMRDLVALIPNETYIRTSVSKGLVWVLDEPAAAEALIRDGLLIDPLDPDLHIELARIHLKQERLDEAEADLRKVIELAPEIPTPYSMLTTLEKRRNDLPAALEWQRRAIEADPQDHELVFELAVDLFALQLPEEAEPWYQRMQALVPGSPMGRALELVRAWELGESEQAVALARSMIEDQVDNRRGSFTFAVYVYTDLMMAAGRYHEGYDFLVATRPEIEDWSIRPGDWQARIMQLRAIALMSGFASFEERRDAWNQVIEASRAEGWDILERNPGFGTMHYLVNGDVEDAIEYSLSERMSEPVAQALWRHRRGMEALYGPLYADPRIAAALNEREREFQQVRAEVQEMLLGEEWN